MAAASLVVAIVAVVIAFGALVQSARAFRRSGWVLDVDTYWDKAEDCAYVEITNTGRQACVISEIRSAIGTKPPFGVTFPQILLTDEGPEDSIAPSATIAIAKRFDDLGDGLPLPAVFSLEVWAWTAGHPFKSKREICRRSVGEMR